MHIQLDFFKLCCEFISDEEIGRWNVSLVAQMKRCQVEGGKSRWEKFVETAARGREADAVAE